MACAGPYAVAARHGLLYEPCAPGAHPGGAPRSVTWQSNCIQAVPSVVAHPAGVSRSAMWMSTSAACGQVVPSSGANPGGAPQAVTRQSCSQAVSIVRLSQTRLNSSSRQYAQSHAYKPRLPHVTQPSLVSLNVRSVRPCGPHVNLPQVASAQIANGNTTVSARIYSSVPAANHTRFAARMVRPASCRQTPNVASKRCQQIPAAVNICVQQHDDWDQSTCCETEDGSPVSSTAQSVTESFDVHPGSDEQEEEEPRSFKLHRMRQWLKRSQPSPAETDSSASPLREEQTPKVLRSALRNVNSQRAGLLVRFVDEPVLIQVPEVSPSSDLVEREEPCQLPQAATKDYRLALAAAQTTLRSAADGCHRWEKASLHQSATDPGIKLDAESFNIQDSKMAPEPHEALVASEPLLNVPTNCLCPSAGQRDAMSSLGAAAQETGTELAPVRKFTHRRERSLASWFPQEAASQLAAEVSTLLAGDAADEPGLVAGAKQEATETTLAAVDQNECCAPLGTAAWETSTELAPVRKFTHRRERSLASWFPQEAASRLAAEVSTLLASDAADELELAAGAKL